MNTRALQLIEPSLPDLSVLLAEGGDARIELRFGRNEYGCRPYPDPDLAAFGSSTASTISESAFRAAGILRERLRANPDEAACRREFDRIRQEFAALCGMSDPGGSGIVFAASGTDVHLIASRIIQPACAVMVDRAETGRGVPAALAGRHFSAGSAFGADAVEVLNVAIRESHGAPRDGREIDAEVVAHVASAVGKGGRVLIVLADVSKTGMIAPSVSCALELKRKFPDSVEIMVDACQFRMSPGTLRSYLGQGFMVALTGSKFMTGPTFSGALLMPQGMRREIPRSLQPHAAGIDWPRGMRSASLGGDVNFGLLLRWEAALAEMRAFCQVSEEKVGKFLTEFAGKVRHRLEQDSCFESLPVPPIDRTVLVENSAWDHIQTIFPFILKKGGLPLGQDETKKIHALLLEDLSDSHPLSEVAGMRCSLGQPVLCGERGGIPLSALRLCASARLVVEGVANGDAVIERALSALDKLAMLLRS